MESLLAVCFRDRRRAVDAFKLLWELDDKLLIELNDAMIVHRDRDGNLQYSVDFAADADNKVDQAGIWGVSLGALVAVGSAIAMKLPLDFATWGTCVLAGGMIGVVAGACAAAANEAWWRDHLGAAKGLVQEVAVDIAPNESAVVAWLDSTGLENAARAFRGFGGKVLPTTLPAAETAKIASLVQG